LQVKFLFSIDNHNKFMKYKLNPIFLLLFIGSICAQTKDSIAYFSTKSKISYKQFITPAALVISGSVVLTTALNKDFQRDANTFFGKDFKTHADNLILFAPSAQIYLGKQLGLKPKNNFYRQTINMGVANVMAVSITMILKHSFRIERPDQSDNLSFPSGHTTIAFTNASLLFDEFKDSNIWYASSGFLFATATGALRIANNEHYLADVLVGAGIGMASAVLVSHWNPLKSLNFGKNKKNTAFVYPQIGSFIGLGTIVQLN
jgi:membrane-associated phospholipid phosphatase